MVAVKIISATQYTASCSSSNYFLTAFIGDVTYTFNSLHVQNNEFRLLY